jgi:uncharacterized protein (DUF362 family)
MSDGEDPKAPAEYGRIGRRELLKRWGWPALAGVVLAGAGRALRDRPGRHQPPDSSTLPRPRDWRIDPNASGRLVTAQGQGPTANLQQALEALGGIEEFVHRGEKVVIKPNCAWDRTPEQAANTDPELVAELVRLSLAAGAASVVVADSTCHAPGRAFARSGIESATREVGGRTAHQEDSETVRLDLGGTQLGPWEVLRPLAEADRVINVPVVKHHSLARATLGMKNWIGALVGNRSPLHQRLSQVTAELGATFRPTLTVIDATRILTGGGPTGGSLALVESLDRIAVATDPVAADTWGATLLDLGPQQLPYIDIAARLGLGTRDWESIHEAV